MGKANMMLQQIMLMAREIEKVIETDLMKEKGMLAMINTNAI